MVWCLKKCDLSTDWLSGGDTYGQSDYGWRKLELLYARSNWQPIFAFAIFCFVCLRLRSLKIVIAVCTAVLTVKVRIWLCHWGWEWWHRYDNWNFERNNLQDRNWPTASVRPCYRRKIQPVESIFFLLIYEFCILFLVKLREILKINYIKLIANKPWHFQGCKKNTE